MSAEEAPTAENGAPTFDEIQRVGRYWRRVEDLLCEHPEMVFWSNDGPVCNKCDRPLSVLSDVQIEDLRARVAPPGADA